jgi:hypothetical protein
MKQIALWTALSLALISAAPTQAQDDYHFATTVEYEYANQLDFEVTIFAPERVTRAAVVFRPISSQDSEVVYAELTETGIGAFHATASIDLRQNPLPPFTTVEYQWMLELADGGSRRSPTYEFRYFDNRFDWQTLSGNDVTVHWVEGNMAFGQAALDIAVESRFEIGFELGLNRIPPTEVFIYPSQGQLQSALGLAEPGWVGGHADPANRSILLSTPNDPEYRLALETDIPHEMTHLLLYQLLGEQGYQHLPGWLSEGLAAIHQGNPSASAPQMLVEARQDGRLLDFESLCGAFPYAEDEAALAYAQSQSFVGFLQEQYGNEALLDLVQVYGDNVGCQVGVERVYDRTLPQLTRLWQQDALGATSFSLDMGEKLPWIALLLPVMIVLAIALLIPWQERRFR